MHPGQRLSPAPRTGVAAISARTRAATANAAYLAVLGEIPARLSLFMT